MNKLNGSRYDQFRDIRQHTSKYTLLYDTVRRCRNLCQQFKAFPTYSAKRNDAVRKRIRSHSIFYPASMSIIHKYSKPDLFSDLRFVVMSLMRTLATVETTWWDAASVWRLYLPVYDQCSRKTKQNSPLCCYATGQMRIRNLLWF